MGPSLGTGSGGHVSKLAADRGGPSPHHQESPMKILSQDLAVGDILEINGWNLHVIGVDRDRAVAILTAEFNFLIHIPRDKVVSIKAPAAAA
jgi:hypothetical protein